MVIDGEWKCGACGYDLSGLGQRGTCPECGNPYDAEHGYGLTTPRSGTMLRYERGRRVTFWVKFGLLAGVATLCVAAGAIRGLTAANTTGGIAWSPLVIGLLAGSAFAFGALVTWITDERD